MLRILCFFFCFSLGNNLSAQTELVNYNYIYDEDVKSVRFHLDGLLLSYPIIDLGSPSQLYLTFDVFGDEAGNYMYKVQHCDADWNPSELEDFEFVNGFNYGDIENYDFSSKTTINYTNFNMTIPNDDTEFIKSGNYLLHVYDNDDNDHILFTRRFLVVEPILEIVGQPVRPSMVSKMDTHQEIDFTIDHDNFDIRNPKMNIRATIIQNGQWQTAIEQIEPFFIKTKRMEFDYTNKIVFKAGKEWRFINLRSLQNRSRNIEDIQYSDDGYDVTLSPDLTRDRSVYIDYEDINGNFIIENIDFRGNYFEADYAQVFFTLKDIEYANKDVYILGAFNDFRPRESYKMIYNDRINAYVAQILFKQGYHDFQYATVDRTTKEVNYSEIEGDDYQTDNDYTIIIYYRPFGARYDRIIGVKTINSRAF